jgi:hypothetical protein
MKKFRPVYLLFSLAAIVAFISACNFTELSESAQESDLQSTIDAAIVGTSVARTMASGDSGQDDGSANAEDSQSDAPESATETPQPESTATVEHQVRPGEPGNPNTWVSDNSSKSRAASKSTGADLFNTNFLERPFTSEVMDYLDYLDLTRVNLSIASPWVYSTFVLEGSPPADSEAVYALEIDLESDGRGDWLMLGKVPAGTEWTTEGAQAFQDINGDVGGFSPMNAEEPNTSWDGYETLVFEDYFGSDPDAVWIRRDPGNPNQVQLAFKYSLIGSDAQFAFGGWADEGMKDPGAFDYNDSMTFGQAGSPFAESSRYPIKELASVDNTCRWTYGYNPTTSFPGLCPLPATPTPSPTPSPTPPPSSISGGVFDDRNNNRSRNSGEPGISNVTVRLGSGACGSTGMASTTTASNGSFRFGNLAAGTYCVSVNIVPECGGWLPTTTEQRTVTLGPGEAKLIAWFGYAGYVC